MGLVGILFGVDLLCGWVVLRRVLDKKDSRIQIDPLGTPVLWWQVIRYVLVGPFSLRIGIGIGIGIGVSQAQSLLIFSYWGESAFL